jgi:HD-GYP domain-containing protein (c-di-GMP phosphodiesterase class II)
MKTISLPETPSPQSPSQLEPGQVRLLILEAECLAERDLGKALNAALEAAQVAQTIKDRLSGTHALLLAGQCALRLGLYDQARGILREAFLLLELPEDTNEPKPQLEHPNIQSTERFLGTLSRALESRDLETAGHTERVVNLSLRLGRALGLHPATLNALRIGAYLHDIGKMAIPDTILLKPGAFTPEERFEMQRHSELGHRLAALIPGIPQAALAVVRHHHERWDGRGYPDKIQGEKIPLLARIFSVIDVYDALCHARSYKHAWNEPEALIEIKAQSGAQFDPTVVSAFLSIRSIEPLESPEALIETI